MSASDDPMHINNVRARHAADSAEREMYRKIAAEIDGPKSTPFGLIKKALGASNDKKGVQ